MDSRLSLVLGLAALAAVVLYLVPFGLWISAISAGVPLRLIDLVGMRLRKVPPARIVGPLITAHKAGIPVAASQLEAHYLVGGRVREVVYALISADLEGDDLTFEQAALADLTDGGRARRA